MTFKQVNDDDLDLLGLLALATLREAQRSKAPLSVIYHLTDAVRGIAEAVGDLPLQVPTTNTPNPSDP